MNFSEMFENNSILRKFAAGLLYDLERLYQAAHAVIDPAKGIHDMWCGVQSNSPLSIVQSIIEISILNSQIISEKVQGLCMLVIKAEESLNLLGCLLVTANPLENHGFLIKKVGIFRIQFEAITDCRQREVALSLSHIKRSKVIKELRARSSRSHSHF